MTDSDPDPTRTETQFRELRTQIHELLGRLDAAVDREAEAMGPRLKKAQERLHELRESSADAWQDLKPGLRNAWEELQKSLNQAASRFKSRPDDHTPDD